jgi:hypothetical protein
MCRHTSLMFKDVSALKHHAQEVQVTIHSLEQFDIARPPHHIRCVHASMPPPVRPAAVAACALAVAGTVTGQCLPLID